MALSVSAAPHSLSNTYLHHQPTTPIIPLHRHIPLLNYSHHGMVKPVLKISCSRSSIVTFAASVEQSYKQPSTHQKQTAIVWFKHDLRIDDHPGLCQASNYQSLIPLYVFDPFIYSKLSKEKLEFLVEAVGHLKRELKESGSDLVIRTGNTSDILVKLLKEVNACHIITEEEVEYGWTSIVDSVSESLLKLDVLGETPSFIVWHARLFEFKSLDNVPDSYRDFKKMRCSFVSPISIPTLPSFPFDLETGELPDANTLKELVIRDQKNNFGDGWDSVKSESAFSILKERQNGNTTSVADMKNIVISGGTKNVLNAFDGYVRFLESTWRTDYQEVHEKVRSSQFALGASFRPIFGPALSLGIISRRRVYYEAIKYEKERNAGWVSPFGYSAFTISAAVEDCISMEWYWFLALKSRQSTRKGLTTRTWMWKDILLQYTTAGSQGPSIVLVHGFGAFWEHYRDNINAIAEKGYKVFALTLIGFGRSEKPNISYSEALWAELLRDFIVDVIREPAHIVGNSFGGYLVSLVARLWPDLIKSVVLCNPGGKIVPTYKNVQYIEPDRGSTLSTLGARFLLFYLQTMAQKTLKRFYPVNPQRADEWLLKEILRSSYDPNSLVVMESIASLKLSLPLNYLLDSYGKKVMLIQGNKDPIFQSRSMIKDLQTQCKQVVSKVVDAGHCPHDEIPDMVNMLICEWVQQCERVDSY